MELLAGIEGIRALKEPCEIDFYTDSEYLRKGITEWMKGWKVRGWQTRDKQPVKNSDLWRELDRVQATHKITWRWVKGHAGNEHNERCDELARGAVLAIRRSHRPEQLKSLLKAFKQAAEAPAPARSAALF